MWQGAGFSFCCCSGESKDMGLTGGTGARTVSSRIPLDMVSRDKISPSVNIGGLDPSEVCPWGTQGDKVVEEQEG